MIAMFMVVAVISAPVASSDEPVAAKPEADSGQTWSVVGGRTVGEGHGAIEGAVGWPGVSVAYLRGAAPQFDAGLRASFMYGREGLVSGVLPGVKLQGLLKLRLFTSGNLSLAATFEPGPYFNVEYGLTVWGFALPVGVRLGIAASSALTLGISFDVPLWVQFGPAGGVNVPFLPGVGVEYFVKSNLLVFARARMGPTLRPYRLAEFTLDAQLGIGWRM